jgi:hypothetical protein
MKKAINELLIKMETTFGPLKKVEIRASGARVVLTLILIITLLALGYLVANANIANI